MEYTLYDKFGIVIHYDGHFLDGNCVYGEDIMTKGSYNKFPSQFLLYYCERYKILV